MFHCAPTKLLFRKLYYFDFVISTRGVVGMTTRLTRASAVKEAKGIVSTDESNHVRAPQQLSSPPATPSPTKVAKPRSKKPANQKSSSAKTDKKTEPRTPVSTRKRKRAATSNIEADINELPHNLGNNYSAETTKKEAEDDSLTDRRLRPRKSTPAQVKKEKASGRLSDADTDTDSRVRAKDLLNDSAAQAAAAQLASQVKTLSAEVSPKKSPTKSKANPYGLTPGQTPYPDWPHPTAEECQEVTDLLSKVHGEVKAPATIPAPSTIVSGCGEVPSVLDALIRTLLSAATTGTNSSRAFKGLVDAFGILQEGVGKGSVDWDRVRRADVADVFKAIKSGGLAATKSKRIKEILDMVHNENLARRDALVKAKEEDQAPGPAGAEHENDSQKQEEIALADQHVLSLDYLHVLSSDDALNALIKYPGIGPKTASCVLLFCMQRPSFAVDTHVFRLCKWLNWVPPDKATRNTAYSHCEVRVPDQLKYPLHQLLIRHGKTCPRCRAATSEGSEGWDKGCPIDHLVKRTGKRKGKADGRKGRKKNTKKVDSEESDSVAEVTNESGETESE